MMNAMMMTAVSGGLGLGLEVRGRMQTLLLMLFHHCNHLATTWCYSAIWLGLAWFKPCWRSEVECKLSFLCFSINATTWLWSYGNICSAVWLGMAIYVVRYGLVWYILVWEGITYRYQTMVCKR